MQHHDPALFCIGQRLAVLSKPAETGVSGRVHSGQALEPLVLVGNEPKSCRTCNWQAWYNSRKSISQGQFRVPSYLNEDST